MEVVAIGLVEGGEVGGEEDVVALGEGAGEGGSQATSMRALRPMLGALQEDCLTPSVRVIPPWAYQR